ncbi:sulfatase-like hydrolase/transferase [Prosthecobacter sp.]|uniref:sulfatase-like hydrolase/transferase n=1 Tax=Prosthecobacter sp. TaxID=1965333 RepID=UPI002ABBEAB8|nr:sulfatase-like hydrolase/transferase [Prosthecobacter sp.]MDZ4403394.1 sulfatase-like hydrolase/transferase [Prosthecobacter sp.]
MKTCLILLSSLALLHASFSAQPNVVLIMADDQGWGDTGYNGHPELKTPNLDALAASGLRMNRFYTAHFNCSPTRASVMTGRHPNRMGTFSPGSPIRAQELTVAKVLQSAGYATGHFGKWHLNGKNGDKNTTTMPGRAIMADDPLSPGKMGFDEWVSADNFFDLDPVLGRQGVAEKFQGDSSDITTDEALKFIKKQATAGKPFLTVVWFGSPHVPHEALPADKALYSTLSEADQNYYGEITAVDRSVGRLRAALRELKVADNTMLWYNSDNGGANGPKSTGNLRGSKGTMWEGGVRVPGLVEWPARITKPFISEVPCSTLDIYPTVLEATGAVAQNQVQPLDGVSLIPLFDHKTEVRSKAIPFWNHAGKQPGHATLIDWPYKLHTNPVAGRDKKGKKGGEALPAMLLYDISKDPKETTDLTAQDPERVVKMTSALEAWKESVEKSLSRADYK